MNIHSEKFWNFINELHDNEINYMIIRGFTRFPESGDTDIDMVVTVKDWDKFNDVANNHLTPCDTSDEHFKNFGFGEYVEMMLQPYYTEGEKLPEIANGCFRVDVQNAFYFKTPYTDFSTFWPVYHKFQEYIFDNKILVGDGEFKYFIPNVGCEITLLLLRDLLDKKHNNPKIDWHPRHKERIKVLVNQKEFDEEDCIKCISMGLPPSQSKEILDKIKQDKFEEIVLTY